MPIRMPSKEMVLFVLVVSLIALGIGRAIYGCAEGWQIYEDNLTIKEAIKKTSGGERREVEYFIFTDKGYFYVRGEFDSDGIRHIFKTLEIGKTYENSLFRLPIRCPWLVSAHFLHDQGNHLKKIKELSKHAVDNNYSQHF